MYINKHTSAHRHPLQQNRHSSTPRKGGNKANEKTDAERSDKTSYNGNACPRVACGMKSNNH